MTKLLNFSLIEIEKCHSTNAMMTELIRNNTAEEGTVLRADYQSKGKGQRENTWQSNKDENLLFSLCLSPKILPLKNIFHLTIITSLALIETLNHYKVQASIKWPNDIYVDDNKICGVLIENILKGNRLEKSIIGIGLNVNQKDFGELSASSIYLESSHKENISNVLDVFLKFIKKYYTFLLNEEMSLLMKLYHLYLYQRNKWANYNDGEDFKGKITGVNENGLLEVEKKSGDTFFYSLKEIKFI